MMAFCRVQRGMADAFKAWDQFWFTPADPLIVGMIRLLTGWMLFYNLAVWTLDLEAFFSDDGLQPLEQIRAIHGSRMTFSFWLWTGDQWLWPMHAACLAISMAFCLGLASRVTSVLSFLITISYSQRVPIANFGYDQILGLLCLYLSLAPSGAALSLDNLIRRWRAGSRTVPSVRYRSARVAMRLIQLHLCAIYFWAGFAKLKGPSWWTGEAMWRVIANQEYQTMDLTWMASVPWLPYLIAHVTIIWEVFFIVLIWNVRLRPLILAVGVAMHVGIGAFLGMWTFGLIMAFAYLAFSDPDLWRARLNDLFRRMPAGPDDNTPVPAAADNSEIQFHDTSRRDRLASWSANDLTTGDPVIRPADHQHVPGTMPRPDRVCIVSASDRERAALRKHLLDHQISCCAVSDPDAGIDLIHASRVSAVILCAAGLTSETITSFVCRSFEHTDLPVLLLVPKLTSLPVDTLHLSRCVILTLPVSLRDIRLNLQRILSPAFLMDVPQLSEPS